MITKKSVAICIVATTVSLSTPVFAVIDQQKKESLPSENSAIGKTCVKATEKDISELFDRWNESLKSGDPNAVAMNYADDSVLLPTLSGKARFTYDERVDYFRHFLEKKPVGHIDSRTIRIGCNKAVDVGLYTFKFKDKSEVKARYTYTYRWNGKKWMITSHHSSLIPTG